MGWLRKILHRGNKRNTPEIGKDEMWGVVGFRRLGKGECGVIPFFCLSRKWAEEQKDEWNGLNRDLDWYVVRIPATCAVYGKTGLDDER